jgi:hypothetical protein
VQLNEAGNKSSVLSTDQLSKDQIKSGIDKGEYAKPLQEKK